MTINAAPILYGRTYNLDFSSFFLAQPACYSKEQAAKVFSVVQGSMDHTDFMPSSGRIIIHSDGKFITYGRTVVFSELYAECNREPVCDRLDHKDGREAYGFIGIVFEALGKEKPTFKLPSGMLCDLYQELILPRWEEEVRAQPSATEMRTFEMNELTSQLVDGGSIRSATSGTQRAYLCNTEESLSTIIDGVLKLSYSGVAVSFCSDADDIRAEYRSLYNIIACRNENSLNSLAASEEAHRSIPSTSGVSQSHETVSSRVQHNRYNMEHAVRRGSLDDQLQRLSKDGKKKQTGSNFRSTYETSQTLPSSGLKKELERFRCSEGIKTSKTDVILTLGTVAGVTYFVIGAINSANPLVLATVGAVTIVLAGIEAKRVIDRFRT